MNTSPDIHRLRIQLPQPGQQAAIHWAGFDAQQILLASGVCHLHALPPHKQLELIVPAACLAAHTVPAQAHGGRHTTAIAMQALEDTLLGTRDDAHITLGESTAAGRIAWVCSKQQLGQWLADLLAAGLKPDSAHTEFSLLPPGENAASISTGGGTLFRTREGQYGYVEDPAILQALLGDRTILQQDALLTQARQPNAVNLLNGAFAPHHQAGFQPRQLRRSVCLLLALGSLLLLGSIIQWQQLNTREKNLTAEIRQTFAAHYPGTPIIDPVLQWESKQREASNSNSRLDALDTLGIFANGLGSGLQPRSAEWRNGIIRLVINDSELARLRPRLHSEGQAFSIQPAEAGFSRLEIRTEQKP